MADRTEYAEHIATVRACRQCDTVVGCSDEQTLVVELDDRNHRIAGECRPSAHLQAAADRGPAAFEPPDQQRATDEDHEGRDHLCE